MGARGRSGRRRALGGVLVAAWLVVACGGSDDGGDGGDEGGAPTTAEAGGDQGTGSDGDGDGEGAGGGAGNGSGESGGGYGEGAVDAAGEWTVVEPAEHGIDAAGLEAARAYAFDDPTRHTQGVVVVHEGEIVGEWYADGADADSWTASWSVAKSFASATVGIALEEGAIPSVDEPLTTWYPDWAGTDKEAITLRDVLQMSTGLAWNEDYDPGTAAESEIIAMVTGQADQLTYAASIEPEVPSASRWAYSSGDTMLLSGVVEQAVGEPLGDYAAENLFEPIGMEQVEWWEDAEGHTLAYCCLDSSSRDLARFGQLFLQEGRWGGEQVVPAEWVADSLEPAETSLAEDAAPYGYQWWLQMEGLPEGSYAAQGHDGQFIYVVPSLDLVVVRNGTYVKSDGPATADPNLFEHYPPSGLVEGRGTTPPEEWDEAEFLGPIVEAVEAAG